MATIEACEVHAFYMWSGQVRAGVCEWDVMRPL
jgi:hypothetical protein